MAEEKAINQESPESESGSAIDSGSPCPECHAGVMRLHFITYFTWLNQELVTVPNFPAWVCDVCRRREFDNRAISWLNTLLNPSTGRRANNRRRRNLPPRMDRPQTDRRG